MNLVMECAPTNLHRMIGWHASAGRTIDAGRAKLYAYQMFRGLDYLHGSAGLCHRDVKPSNLLLYPAAGVLKLCDFGSAKDLSDGRPNSSYACSRRYRAPELLFADGPAAAYTNAVDVWSAGCVYAEIIAGRPAYPGTSRAHQRALVGAARPPVLPAASPAPVVRLVVAALRFDPELRVTAAGACGHECFDAIRIPDVLRSDGRPLPPLFDDHRDGADDDGDWTPPPLFHGGRPPTARKYYHDDYDVLSYRSN